MKVIIKAADYGLTPSVMYGVYEGFSKGMITCTGLMTNFPWSKQAAEFAAKHPHLCLGQDINITVGRPVSDPGDVPSMVNEDGTFIGSAVHRTNKDYQISYDEAVLETEAQVKKYIEFCGHVPEYMQSHANKGSGKAIIQNAIDFVSKKYGVKVYTFARERMYTPTLYEIPFSAEAQIKRNLEEDIINDRLGILNCGKEVVMLNLHPGYLGKDLEAVSTFTVIRIDDLRVACSNKVKKWFIAHDIEVISYRDIQADY